MARSGLLWESLGASLARVLWGLVIGIALGVPLGILSCLSRLAELCVDRPLQMLRAIPFNALPPVLIMLFGVGEPMKVSLIVIGVCVPLYLNTRAGIVNFDPKLLELAQVYRMPRLVVAWEVLCKGVLPSSLTGLRFALAFAWLALVTSETVNAASGIGYVLSRAQQFARLDQVMVCILLYALLGLLTDWLVRTLEQASTRWRPRSEISFWRKK
jgi:sulfonate transport system permease protein